MSRRSRTRDGVFAAQAAAGLARHQASIQAADSAAPGVATEPVRTPYLVAAAAEREQDRTTDTEESLSAAAVEPTGPEPARPPDSIETPWRRATVVLCIGAHPQAGTSTVACAIADAAAASASPEEVRLLDGNPPDRTGLSWAAEVELGQDVTGRWSLGRRAGVHLMRRTAADLPALPAPAAGSLQVIDGVATAELLPSDVTMRLVLVCRASVPSLRAAEGQLAKLADQAPVLAVLGPARWPGVVTAALGPAVSQLRDLGRVVAVPVDKQLEMTGVTSKPLPRGVVQSGIELLRACTTPPQPPAAGLSEEGNQG